MMFFFRGVWLTPTEKVSMIIFRLFPSVAIVNWTRQTNVFAFYPSFVNSISTINGDFRKNIWQVRAREKSHDIQVSLTGHVRGSKKKMKTSFFLIREFVCHQRLCWHVASARKTFGVSMLDTKNDHSRRKVDVNKRFHPPAEFDAIKYSLSRFNSFRQTM